MGLYNFQERFVSKILSGEKTHTIRAERAHPDKPGNTLHLYSGLRTKKAKLLMRALCVKVEEIHIRAVNGWDVSVAIDGVDLDETEREALARRDGFDDFAEMVDFWRSRLPFHGHIIHWQHGSCLVPSQVLQRRRRAA